jgi:predicted RNase H-like nuclease (RuvC/YqgF family)
MEINDRIRIFLKYKKITIQNFEISIGRTNGYLSHTKSPTANVIKDIIRVYPELNLSWLIAGEGEMLKSTNQNNNSMQPKNEELFNEVIKAKDETIQAQEKTIHVLDKRVEDLESQNAELRENLGLINKQKKRGNVGIHRSVPIKSNYSNISGNGFLRIER